MKKLPFLVVVLLISTCFFNIHAQPDYLSERWHHTELGINLGVGCLYSLDLDNDGNDEILVISDLLGDSFFSILELENGEFKTKCTSEIYEFYFKQ